MIAMFKNSTFFSFYYRLFSFVVVLLFCGSAIAQNVVTGRIVDSTTNEGIPRVSVLVKGTRKGVVTDAAGNFRINAVPGDVLTISSLGFNSQELPITGSVPINIILSAQTAQLNEVVVIGYGQKSRKLSTESISSIAAKDIQKLPVASADAAIQGRVSGVQITNVDGSPGSPVSVRVRGVGTVGNTQPLFCNRWYPCWKHRWNKHQPPCIT